MFVLEDIYEDWRIGRFFGERTFGFWKVFHFGEKGYLVRFNLQYQSRRHEADNQQEERHH